VTRSAELVNVDTVVRMVVVAAEVNNAVEETVCVVVMVGMCKNDEQNGVAEG
jgi:hypothetical protein